MTCIVSGRVVIPGSDGSIVGLANKKIIIAPSRDDFEYSLDGANWQPWEGDPAYANTYPGSVVASTDSSGTWSFVLPWTDSSTDVRLPGGSPIPGLMWNILDPNPTTGPRNIYGPLRQAIAGSAKTTRELITLAAPDTWQVGSSIYSAVLVGFRRYVDLTFTSSMLSAGFVMPDIGTSAWRFSYGIETDDPARSYGVIVDRASKTNTGATLRISDVPPPGKIVVCHLEIYP